MQQRCEKPFQMTLKLGNILRSAQNLGLVVGLAILAFDGAFRPGAALAQPQPPTQLPTPTIRPAEPGTTAAVPPAVSTPIEGFRQARFGMPEQQVRQAILRDFPAAAGRLARSTHPREKTTVLTITTEDLLPDVGLARVSYILGYSSKQLVQINIVWTSDGRSAARDEAIVAAANSLREHFQTQYYPPDEILANRPVGENAILVFRAGQADGRMVLLLLSGVAAVGRAERKPAPPPLSLQLSYIRNHANLDIFRIERGGF